MLSAYLTLGLVVLHYLFDNQIIQNTVDRRFLNLVTPKTWNNDRTVSRKWSEALEGAVLLYSDTQVITGMAVGSFCFLIVLGLAWLGL